MYHRMNVLNNLNGSMSDGDLVPLHHRPKHQTRNEEVYDLLYQNSSHHKRIKISRGRKRVNKPPEEIIHERVYRPSRRKMIVKDNDKVGPCMKDPKGGKGKKKEVKSYRVFPVGEFLKNSSYLNRKGGGGYINMKTNLKFLHNPKKKKKPPLVIKRKKRDMNRIFRTPEKLRRKYQEIKTIRKDFEPVVLHVPRKGMSIPRYVMRKRQEEYAEMLNFQVNLKKRRN